MAYLQEWVRQVAVVTLFAAVADLMVPAGASRAYVRVVLGLLVVLAVLQPLVDAFGQGVDWSRSFAAVAPPTRPAAVGVAEEEGSERLRAVQRALTVEAYAALLARQAEAVAANLEGVVSARAAAVVESDPSSLRFGQLRGLQVAVAAAGGPGAGLPPAVLAGRVREALARSFGLSPDHVDVTVTTPAGRAAGRAEGR
ncbi:MAG: stage III sporulation protein AF [Clostridia bacterium]|nr:stage III sporulation protein AF [Clostridia bacterium]